MAALNDTLRALLDEAVVREINHLRCSYVQAKHSRALTRALCDAKQRNWETTQQLSAAELQIVDITHDLEVCMSSSWR